MDWHPISIEQYVGRRCGVLVTEPLDWVVVHHPQKGAVRIGLVGQWENATVKLLRFFKPEIQQHILKRVVELRKERSACSVADRLASIPNPRLIAGYLKGERYRKRPTVVQGSAGMPAEGRKQREPRKRLYVPGRD